MPEYRAQNIDQRDADNKNANGKMKLHVRHNQTPLHGSQSGEPGAVAYNAQATSGGTGGCLG